MQGTVGDLRRQRMRGVNALHIGDGLWERTIKRPEETICGVGMGTGYLNAAELFE